MRSLSLKLTLAFLLVSVLAVALVGVSVTLLTRYAFDRFDYDRDVVSFANMLESYYRANGGWAGVESVMQRPRFEKTRAEWSRQPIALLDAERNLIFGLGEFASGKSAPARGEVRDVRLQDGEKTIGWLIIGRLAPPAPDRTKTPEEALRQRIVGAIAWATVGAIGLALIVGAVLARTLARPIQELTDATRLLAKGELGKQVPIRSQDELGQLAASFNTMSADLARTSETRRSMTADIAHELRTPLAVQRAQLEAMQDGVYPLTADGLQVAIDQTEILSRLVDDLRTMALADAGELTLEVSEIDPGELLDAVGERFRPQAELANVKLSVQRPVGRLAVIKGDRVRLEQILNNLLSNALRYTPEGGSVDIRLQITDAVVAITVKDTGPGIPPESLPHIFDRFYRAEKSRSRSEGGTGLGLAISRQLAHLHHGSLTAANATAGGAEFTLTLPR